MKAHRLAGGRTGPARRTAGACAVVAAAALSAGIVSAPAGAFELFGKTFFSGGKDSAREAVPDAVPYQVTFRVAPAQPPLESDLAELSLLVSEQESPPSGLIGVIARARSDRTRLVAALYDEGRYGATVDIAIAGQPLDEIELDPDRSVPRPVPVTVTVEPGPLFRFADIDIRIAGGGSEDPAAYGLVAGEAARSGAVLAAETQLVRTFQERGHPFAAVADRDIVADHGTATLDVALTVEPGPIASFGTVRVEGTKRVEPDFVVSQAAIPAGHTYDPRVLEKAAERLRRLGIFQRITVEAADRLEPGGSVPITITVSESKPRTIGAGATVDSEDGLGIEGYWRHRNLFGRAERFGVEAAIGRLGNVSSLDEVKLRAALTFAKPGVLGPAGTFESSLAAEFEDPEAFRRQAVVGKAGLTYELDDRQTVSGDLEVEYSDIEDAFGDERHLLAGLPVEYVRDARDDRLDPTRGYRAVVFGAPYYDIEQSVGFFRFGGSLAVYRAVDKAGRFILAGKLGAGTIVGADAPDIPANKRFYAGGANSVRGLGFQQAGPATADGTPTGGATRLEASLEARVWVTETIGIVPFFDAGGIFDTSTAEFGDNVQYGAGLGLRYRTPIGPIRLDVGVPLNPGRGDDRFGVYVGLGQAF